MDDSRFLKFGVAAVVVFIAGVFAKLARPVLVPFCLALFLSFALTPVLDFLVRKKIPKPVALVGLIVLTIVVLLLIGVLFYSSGKSLASELPSYNEMMRSFLEGVDRHVTNPKLKAEVVGWINGLNAEKVGNLIMSALGPFVSFISELMLVFLFLTFILAGRGRMEKKIAQAFSEDRAKTIGHAVWRIDKQVQRYFAVHTLVCLATGALTTLVLALFGLPFAVVFGVLTFLLNFVPTLGSVIATALPVLFSVFYFGTLGPAIGILVLLMAINFILGNAVEPRFLGKGLGLSPLLVLFSLFFGNWMWGIPGMILAVPMLAVLKIVLDNFPSTRFLAVLMS
ncbi:MAG TPA: AI-2E family transporter [Terriglobales bacterium]|nr:AI-2E family transporter [Terriglobales bacterium]